jgi:hypothetical protein
MHTSRLSSWLAVAALTSALGVLAVAAIAAETGADIPKDSYYDDTLTPSERAGIASEENVSPDDGRPSVPAPQDQGVIPDAADPEKGDTTVDAPASGDLPGDVATKKGKSGESEADVIIDDSKKNFRVTQKELDACIGQWDAQTQMTKKEWADSCRTTLQYYPE